MRWKITLLFPIVFLILSGCSTNYRITKKENKLIGAWVFDKVFYKEDGALFRDNFSGDYRGDIIEFYGDYFASYDDVSLGAIFDGWWEILVDEDVFYDDDGSNSELEFFLDMCFDDFIANEEFCYFGSLCRITRNKLVIEATDRWGQWTFKLDRL